jgi:outer membrane protein TolC
MTEINLERAGENLKAANEGFLEGIIPASNLMEAQTAWVKARAERIDAEIEIKINEMNYKKVTGRL